MTFFVKRSFQLGAGGIVWAQHEQSRVLARSLQVRLNSMHEHCSAVNFLLL